MALVLLELQANVGKRLSRRLQEWKGKDGHQAVRHANGHDPGRPLDGMKNVYSGPVDLLEQDLAMLVERLARFLTATPCGERFSSAVPNSSSSDRKLLLRAGWAT